MEGRWIEWTMEMNKVRPNWQWRMGFIQKKLGNFKVRAKDSEEKGPRRSASSPQLHCKVAMMTSFGHFAHTVCGCKLCYGLNTVTTICVTYMPLCGKQLLFQWTSLSLASQWFPSDSRGSSLFSASFSSDAPHKPCITLCAFLCYSDRGFEMLRADVAGRTSDNLDKHLFIF